jgi:hypothetical protein
VDTAAAQAALPAAPAGWPSTLQLGMMDGPGGGAALRATAPFGFRSQYLAGGANTGNGWATWNPNGDFVTYYIQDSARHGMLPVFDYYQLLQSAPSTGATEGERDYTNLQNVTTMRAFYADLKLFMQKAGAQPGTRVLLHYEPDLWGFMQQRAAGRGASSVPAQVAATGLPELAGLPNDLTGFARAATVLRDRYAPNVWVGYHVSLWGTGTDITLADPPDPEIDRLADKEAAFYASLGTPFDLLFYDPLDRDAAFYQYQYGDPHRWWTPEDFRRNLRYLSRIVQASGKRVLLWQIPLGNTKMRAQNNTWNHYQDNRVEWWLDDPGRGHLDEWRRGGVLGFIFGRGADGPTCACDANNDGVTNPAPINGNTRASLNADDDGGYFRERAAAYYAAGPLALNGGGGGAATPTPTPSATVTATSTTAPATPTAPATTAPVGAATPTPSTGSGFTTGATASPASLTRGGSAEIRAAVTSAATTTVLVDAEIYDPAGVRVHQQVFDNEAFGGGQQRTFTVIWHVPANAPSGAYTIKIGVFSPGWGTLHAWNNAAGTFSVSTGTPTATPSPAPSGTALRPILGVLDAGAVGTAADGAGLGVAVGVPVLTENVPAALFQACSVPQPGEKTPILMV